MVKKLFMLFALGQAYFMNGQVIADFESGMSSINGINMMRNQNGIPFSSIDCGISPQTGSVFNYLNSADVYNNPVQKVSLATPGNFEPLLLNHGVQVYTVPSNGGNYSLRLNDTATNYYDISSFTKSFTATGEFVSFDYLAVLDSPHFNNLQVQPFFVARLLDENDNIIPNAKFCLIADLNDPLLINPKYDILYTKDWFCGQIRIPKKYIGKKSKFNLWRQIAAGVRT